MACPQATAAATGPLNLFVCAFTDQQHFVYVDAHGNIQDCWWSGGG